jgi:hypothetical protein
LDVLAKKRYLKSVSLQTDTAQQRTKVKYLFISRFFANTMLCTVGNLLPAAKLKNYKKKEKSGVG